jgi:hypothetical protein
MDISNQNIGKYKVLIWVGAVLVGVLLGSQVGGFDLEARQRKHEANLKTAYANFAQDVNRVYCLPKIADLEKVIEIKKSIKEEVTEYQSSIKELSTKEGCLAQAKVF